MALRLNLISCEVFYREIERVVADSPNRVDVSFLSKGLHDIGAKRMQERVQATLDTVDSTQYDAVLFGYGLCNNGMAGLTARAIPFVLPRAHDCITLFMGSRQRYLEYFDAYPGTYFKTTGWMERGENPNELNQLSIQKQNGLNSRLEEFIAKYGEDNGRYLYETLGDDKHNYGRFTFIEMGVEPDDSFERRTREDAEQRGWEFQKVRGSLSLLQRLVDGDWDTRDFLVVPPGHRVVARYDEGIVDAEPP